MFRAPVVALGWFAVFSVLWFGVDFSAQRWNELWGQYFYDLPGTDTNLIGHV